LGQRYQSIVLEHGALPIQNSCLVSHTCCR
jgi:hypothetical protein